jgi:heavy metal translocating P-type ATPase
MNLKFGKTEKIDILLIVISAISLLISFFIQIDYLSWTAIILCGIPIFKECIKGLVTEFDIKADLLVTIAIIASIIVGEVFAAGEIATIMAIGGFLEEYTVFKTQGKIEELVKLTPAKTTRIKDGKEEKVNVDEIKVGDTIKVLPGETIPCDGIITEGETSINQAPLTGESMPVDKAEGDEVYSGTINLYGSFMMQSTKESEDSSLQKLIKLVESSSPENAKIVKSADRWATWIVIMAFASSLITWFVTGEIIRAVTILVVFCPCALVLATPTAIMASIGNLTKHGILVKDGQSIEELAHVNELIFDKTGTLTYGTPIVVKVNSDDENMMYYLASLESKSEHPLAKAIVNHYGDNNLGKVENFKMILGKGVTGIVDGFEIIAGNQNLLKDENIELAESTSLNAGETEIFVVKNKKVIGSVVLSDTLRSNAKSTMTRLKNLGMKTTLLTGDNEESGSYIANEVKVTNAKFNCLPKDKSEYIRQRQLNNNKVAMIGDGINDAPSLKKANVGIAMGGNGSDISIESANITLINDNIEDIPHLIAIARKTFRTININIAFSLSLNVIAMILAASGILGPIEGALVHNMGSVIVIIYSAMLINYRPSWNDYQKGSFDKNLNKTKVKLYNT